MKRFITVVVLLFCGLGATDIRADEASLHNGRVPEISVEASLQGYGGYSENGIWRLPFWAYTNKRGIVPENSPAVVVQAAGQFLWRLPKGFSVYTAVDGSVNVAKPAEKYAWYQSDKISSQQVNALYVGANWKWIHLDVGMFDRYHDNALWNTSKYCDSFDSPWIDWTGGLGTSNGNIAYSRNSPSMPGYLLYTELIKFGKKKHFGLYAAWGDFFMLEKLRYVQTPKVHHAALYLWFAIGQHFECTLGIEDWAQWSGYNSYEGFQYPSRFKDYVLMCLAQPGRDGASESDKKYVLGNHLGRELIRFKVLTDPVNIILAHDIPFNDGSGMGFQNFPDGINTLKFEMKNRRGWVTDVLYELVYTKNQSGRFHTSPYNRNKNWGGKDTYYNSSDYRTGWNYYGKAMGTPLFTPATVQNAPFTGSLGENGNNAQEGKILNGTANNMVLAHHVGLCGYLFGKAYYKFLFTWSINEGQMQDIWGEYYGEPRTFSGDFEELRIVPKKGPYKNSPWQFSLGFEGFVPVGKHGLSILYGLYSDFGKGRVSVIERADGAYKVYPNSVAVSVGLKYNFHKK